MRTKLNKLGKHTFPDCIFIEDIYNLVTKEKCYQKPIYQLLTKTLLLMKKDMIKNGFLKLAMPCIGSGLDKLEWIEVKKNNNKYFSGYKYRYSNLYF